MKKLMKKTSRFLAIFLVLCLVTVLTYSVVNTYNAYKQMVIEQRQEHLLITSRAVSQNLSLFISEQIRDVDILCRTPGFLQAFDEYYETGESQELKEYILTYMLSQQGVSRIYLMDRDGNQLYRYNHYPFLEEFPEEILHLPELAQRGQNGLGTAFRISPHHYGFTLINQVMHQNGSVGTIVSVLDMETLYNRFVATLQNQNGVDIIVKNDRGTVLMHPNKEVLTFNPFRDIEGLDTLSQYKTFYEMLQDQYTYEEGTAIYRSFTGGIQSPREEIAAYSRMNYGDVSWYVSAVMPYSQVTQLIDRNVGKFGLLVAAILAVTAASILTIYGLQKKRQKLQIETSYLRDINRTLEELHQSREQVRHYQKLQTIGSLAGGIVHEFNNLLTPILGYSEFLKEQMGPDSEYYEDMEEIYKAGSRAKEIVEQILPFSRKETDSTAYGPVSMDAVIRDMLKMLKMILPASISLKTELPELQVSVFGSATQLHQVLLNLCSNAVQSMEKSGGVLTVKAEKTLPSQVPERFCPAQDRDYVVISVSDTGPGIPEDILPHIFDPFFTTKEVGEGTGLGLSVVQNILISHSGFIEVKSQVGEGSTFLVYLPVTHRAALPAAKKQAAQRDPEGKPLLLIDDSQRVAQYLKRRLCSRGYQVDLYTDPEEALAAFREAPDHWGLVIADDTMPKYRGTALIQRMKQDNGSLPVILITGLVERDAVQMQQQKLIDEILIKPVDFDGLLEAIEKLLSRGR